MACINTVQWIDSEINSYYKRSVGKRPSNEKLTYPNRPDIERQPPAIVNLEIDDEQLIQLSNEGLLALNLNEMQTIRDHYRDEATRAARESAGISPNAPTDVELECLAQTWSEHCKHKIFASKIHHIDTETNEDIIVDSLFKTHIMKPTHDMAKEVDWLLSVFHDNSGASSPGTMIGRFA